MSLTSANRSFQFVMQMTDPKTATEPMIDLPPKPLIENGQSSKLPRHRPERHGISPELLAQFLQALQQDPSLRMHSIMVVRDGCVLCEAGFGNQDLTLPRMTFSACKSIVSLAVGMLMDDGLLHADTKVTDLFPQAGKLVGRKLMRDVTVADLLSMCSGNQFNELACMTQADWLEGFFLSPGLSEKFQYNSLNTYMLGRIVSKCSGMSLSDFVERRLFEPLGIRDFYWEVCPMGYARSGWGLYLKAEDLAKIGQLIQNGGMYRNQRLISQEYLKKATSVQAVAPAEYGDFNYGWQFWVGREKDMVLLNGMLGQNVLCFRESGITLVSHAGNDETFQQSNYFKLAQRFFAGPFPDTLPANLNDTRKLRRVLTDLRAKPARSAESSVFQLFFGKRFVARSPRAASTGLLPVTLQAVQNCYTKGVQAIAIGGDRDCVEIFYEERNCLHHILAGTKVPRVQTLCFDGNMFRVAAQVKFTKNEDDFPVLRLQLDFLETPCSRVIKLFLTPQGVILQQTETPCMDKIFETVLSGSHPTISALIAAVSGTGDLEFLRWRMSLLFAPKLEFEQEN